MADKILRDRQRRKFAFGALEQAGTILGAITASTLVVGLLVPTIAAISGGAGMKPAALAEVAMLVVGFAACSAAAALVLRGLARRLEDDVAAQQMTDQASRDQQSWK